MRSRVVAAIVAIASMVVTAVVPPQPAYADAPVIKTTLAITGTSTPVVVRNLTDQSSCTIELNGTATGIVQGIEQGLPVNVNAVQIPDGGTPSYTITGPGEFTANCAGMQVFQFTPTAVTGTVSVTVIASGAVGRIIGAGVNGGRTNIVGSGPITVTNAGNTATVGLTVPLPILDGGTGATALPSGCLQSNGTVVSTTGTACGTGSGTVTAVTASGNLASSGGATPNITETNSPTYTGNITLGISGRYSDNGSGTSVLDLNSGITGGFTQIGTYNNGANNVNGIGGQLLGIGATGTVPSVNIDTAGDVSAAGSFYSTALIAGRCLQASTNGQIVPATAACSTGTVTGVTGTSPIVSSGGATPAISCSTCLTGLTAGNDIVVGTGPSPSVAVTNAPTFTGALSAASLTGTGLTNGRCLQSASGLISVSGGSCVNSVGGAGNITVTAGATPTVSITNAPTFTGLVTGGSLEASGLTSGLCVQTTAGGLLTTAAAACGTGTGTVTSVSGTGNIASTGGNTPTISITNAPSFTGPVTIGTYGTALGNGQGLILAAPIGETNITTQPAGSGITVAGINPYAFDLNNSASHWVAIDNSGNLGLAGNAYIAGLSSSSGDCVQISTNGQLTAAAAACGAGTVTSVSGTGNITSTGGTTPTVAITNSPSFSGTITLTNSIYNNHNCLQMQSANAVGTSGYPCPEAASPSFTIPAVGSTVSIAINPNQTIQQNQTPIIITDGTHMMTGLVTSGANSAAYTVLNTGVVAGAAGNTMSAGILYVGGDGAGLINIEQAGTRLNGIHLESNPSLSVGAATTATFTFAAAYNTAPVCTVSTVGALAPTMSINAAPTTTAVVIYNSGTSGTASVSCDGW